MTVDQLSALDECFLRLETESTHMHVGWTMLLEGDAPATSELRAHVERRLERLPRFRRKVLCSRVGLHYPVWVDDEHFDISRHVNSARVPAGAGPAGLRALAGELLSAPLDRRRPLWRLYLVGGVAPGRFAVVGQVHHALMDGIAAVEMAQLLLDIGPITGTPTMPRPFRPARSPGIVERTYASAGERLGLARSAGSLALRTLGRPSLVAETAEELRRLGSALATVGTAAPRTSLNRPVGPQRSVAFARLPRHAAKELGRRHGATVNDVVLTTASLALGHYLRRIGESHPWLRVLVPVNTRQAEDACPGNFVSAVFVELPIGERDPRATLEEVTRQTREQKRAEHATALKRLLHASRLAPAPVLGAAAWIATRPQTFNVVVSNLPGPTSPLYLLGRRMVAAYPAVPLSQAQGLSIGVLSYCSSLHVGLCADPELVPELADVAHDLTSSFDALRLALEPGAPRPRRPPSRRRVSPSRVHLPA